MKLHLDQHPSFTPGEEDTLEMKLWVKLAENGVLFGPGWMFATKGEDSDGNTDSGHFRISFSNAEVRISKFANAFAKPPEVPRPQESGHNFWTSHPRVL